MKPMRSVSKFHFNVSSEDGLSVRVPVSSAPRRRPELSTATALVYIRHEDRYHTRQVTYKPFLFTVCWRHAASDRRGADCQIAGRRAKASIERPAPVQVIQLS